MVVGELDWVEPISVIMSRFRICPPGLVTLPFAYKTPILSGISVFNVQMVT